MEGELDNQEMSCLSQPRPQHILNCAFQSWYTPYNSLTISSKVIPIPAVVVDYLKDDGMYMPDNITSAPESEWSGHNEALTDDGQRFEDIFKNDKFKSFLLEVKEAISSLGGTVFPKLNWSAPRDASWIALNNSLCCRSPSDIFILLKSSEFTTHDLTNPFLLSKETISRHNIDYHLVLRKWIDMNPANEFRVFVFQRRIIAICQRSEQFAQHVNDHKEKIVRNIAIFFERKIMSKFPEDSFTIDVYLPDFENTVLLIDFNTWCGATDGLLFEWKEISSLCEGKWLDATDIINGVAFRSSPEGGASQITSLQQYAFPLDIQHLSSGEDASKLMDLMKLQQREGHSSTNSDED